MVKRCLILSIASDGFSTRFSPDMKSALSSEISEAPIIVSCEKKATPISSVMAAWKSSSIFPHLMKLEGWYYL